MAKKEIVGEDGKIYEVKEKKKGKGCLVIVGILVILGVIGALLGGEGNDVSVTPANETSQAEAPANETPQAETPAFEITEVAVEQDDFGTYVTGILKNNTTSEKSYIQVTFPVYDAEGNKLGDAMDNVNNVAADGTWKFKAMYIGEQTEGLQIDINNPEVSGF